MPASPPYPVVSLDEGDSLVVEVELGKEPEGEGEGLVRFAAHQTPIELHRSTLRISFSQRGTARPPRVTVKYDVDPTGRVNSNSIEFLGHVEFELEQAIREGLSGARFEAPTSNCRSVAQTVVQVIG